MIGPRTYTCQDCGQHRLYEFARGCLPRRCDECKKKEECCRTKRRRQRCRKTKQLQPVARSWVCCDCGAAAISNSAHGKLPKRCRSCKLKQQRLRFAKVTVHSRCTSCGDNVVASGPRKLCGKCLAVFRQKESFVCFYCGKLTPVPGGKCAKKFCSLKCYSDCAKEMQAGQKIAASIIRLAERFQGFLRRSVRRQQAGGGLCFACGSEKPLVAGKGRYSRFCSEECRQESKRTKARIQRPKGSRKHTTRAKKRGLPRQYSITLYKVAERDEWVCRLCNQIVDGKVDSWHPMAGCIDHIVPINLKANTQHGHVWNNVQLAHRKCNELKGCSLASPSLLDCINPRLHTQENCIDQTPPPRWGKHTK